MQKPIIHGENIFKPIDKLPEGETATYNMFIAGHSESGHHHVVTSDVAFEVIERKDLEHQLYIQLFAPAKVEHQKTYEIHETLTLEPGIYEVYPAQEYDPFEKVMRRIYD